MGYCYYWIIGLILRVWWVLGVKKGVVGFRLIMGFRVFLGFALWGGFECNL